jgi:radical SAM protein with 4Fe4S-binding SPASM domain
MLKNAKRKLGNTKRGLLRGFEKTLGKGYPSAILAMHPVKSIVIEPTNICNFSCPLCPTPLSNRNKGVMSLSDFEKITGNLPSSIQTVDLYFSGEPLINQALIEMVKSLVHRNIYCSVSTNGSLMGSKIEEILDSGLSKLIIGVDAASEDTYKKYRVGGNFTILINNIKKLVYEKRKRNLKHPLIVFQYIVMKHTEKEVDKAVSLARELNVDAISLISVSLGTHRTDEDERKKLAGEYLPDDLSYSRYYLNEGGKLKSKWQSNYCPAWKSPVIFWNGDVTTCCFDHDGLEVYGNILQRSFNEIWKSREHGRKVKNILSRKMKICKTCGLCTGDQNRYIKL